MKWCSVICEENNVTMRVERMRSGPGNIDGVGLPPIHVEVVFLDPGNEHRAVKFEAGVLKGNAILIDSEASDPMATLPRIVSSVIQHPSQMTHATLETQYMDEEQLAQFDKDVRADIKAKQTAEEQEAENRSKVANVLRDLGGVLTLAAEMIEPTPKQEAPSLTDEERDKIFNEGYALGKEEVYKEVECLVNTTNQDKG